MTTTLDPAWTEATRYWNRDPAVVAAAPPADIDRGYATIVTASEPFRLGTRFFAVPDVRFLVGRGRLRAPGDLLPGPADQTLPDYQNRLDARLGDEGYLLVAEQPLLLDFTLWRGVRQAISGLWRQVGWPNLPSTAELVVADRFTGVDPAMRRAGHATLAWVLRGRLDVRLADTTLRAGPGRLLHLPADCPHETSYADRCVVLYLRIPVDPAMAGAAVRELVAGLMTTGDDAVPYLRWDDGAEAPELAGIAARFRDVIDSDALARALRIRWAVCRSAAGLEPVPPPRASPELTPDTVVRRRCEVVRLPDGRDRWVWVVNGHAFPVAGTGGDRLLALLALDRPTTVGELSRALTRTDQDRGVTALLSRLAQLRGVDPEEATS